MLNGDLVTQVDIGAPARLPPRRRYRGDHRHPAVRPHASRSAASSATAIAWSASTRSRRSRARSTPASTRSSRAVVALVPPGQRDVDAGPHRPVLARRRAVGAFEVEDDWIDVGQRDELARAAREAELMRCAACRSWSPAPTASSAATSSSASCAEGAESARSASTTRVARRAGSTRRRPRSRARASTSGSATSATRGSSSDATEGVEVVFHLAALIAIPYSYVAAESFVETNVRGTLNVLEAAARAGVGALVQTSTSEVYGTPDDAADPRDASAAGPVAVRGDQGRGRPARARLPAQLRPAGRRSCGRSTPTGRASRRARCCRRCSASSSPGGARSASAGSTPGAT